LEGSVQIEGKRLRITAQLIKVVDDSHLWAETYDREMSDFFAIQEEISRAIVGKLRPRLLDKRDRPLATHYTENVEAHGLYLQGRCFEIKHSFEKAFEHFEKALALDPNYALAYAGIADTYNRMAWFQPESPKEYFLKAKSATLKALENDDTLTEAYASLGYLKVHYEWDWEGAERALKRAIELNPGYARARRYYTTYLRAVGRFDEALAEIKVALELDPLSPHVNSRYGLTLLVDGQIDRAIEQLEKTLELYPNHLPALLYLGDAYVVDGGYDDGIALLQKAMSLTEGKSPIVLGILGYAYAEAGKIEEAQEILDEALERSKRGYFSPHFIGMLYTALGDKDKAFKWLDKAYEEHDPGLYAIKGYPLLKRLHSDPRFTALLKKMGLEE
jgi:tetratricopeptide (TPR) repeat protein